MSSTSSPSANKYVRARECCTEKNKLDDSFAVVIDNRPYHPFLQIDPSDSASVRIAVAYLLLSLHQEYKGEDKDNSSVSESSHKFEKANAIATSLSTTSISGGITNTLFRVAGIHNALRDVVMNDDNDTKSNNDMKCLFPEFLLVRVFGAEGMIDRDVENSTFAALAAANLAPAYWGRFANGRAEEWLEGFRHLGIRELSCPKISAAIAIQLARLHNSPNTKQLLSLQKDKEPSMWLQLEDWWRQAVEATFPGNDRDRAAALELSLLESELAWLKDEVVPADSRTAFCHNDLLAANVMLLPQDDVDNKHTTDDGKTATSSETITNHDNVQFIDFEYGGLNYKAFDIANHFNEFAGGTENAIPVYDWLPNMKQQVYFIKTYLQETKLIEEEGKRGLEKQHRCRSDMRVEVEDQQVRNMLREVQAFIKANHLYWGLWAVNQAATEGCQEFDYMEYAANRIKQYWVCKRQWIEAS